MIKPEDPLPVLTSPNAAFRPADVEFGMDGALYVSDFCSPIIGHAQHAMRSTYWDHDFGRIWRVTYTGKPVNKDWPTIEGAGVDQLCKLLVHPQDLVRHHTRIELRKHGAKGLAAVDKWFASLDSSDPNYEQAALEAIFVCGGLDEARPQLIDLLLKSKSEKYRGAAVHTIRLQAALLPNVTELLTSVANDPHPRVQIEVIDAVAHLRPDYPEVEAAVANIAPRNKFVEKSLAYLSLGVEPVKGRSVPVLEVDKNSQLTHWLYFGEKGENKPVEHTVGRGKLPPIGLYRTFVYSDEAQPAVIAVSSLHLEVRLNGALKFSHDSYWSADQQVSVELEPGLNVIDITFTKGRRTPKSMPAVYLYDPVGLALSSAKYPSDPERMRSAAAEYDKLVAERGNVINLQAAAGLQFEPKQLKVTPGSKVRLVFENPDIMLHNWVLLKPGSFEEVGKLADELASSPEGVKQDYLPTSDKILHHSKLLAPKEIQEIVFDAPTEPGEYPYICTFPGHWRIMRGNLIVAEREAPAPVEMEKPTVKSIGKGVMFETTSVAKGFKTIVPNAKAGRQDRCESED